LQVDARLHMLVLPAATRVVPLPAGSAQRAAAVHVHVALLQDDVDLDARETPPGPSPDLAQ
jgi:hypothetical protein